jgi:zinc protease
MTTTLTQGIQTVTTQHGMTVYALDLPHSPRLAINLYLQGGNRHDLVPGMQDVLDRLVLKGTTTYDQEAFAIALDSLSLELDMDTRRDYSVMAATLLPEDWQPALALMNDVLHNATFTEFDRETERMVGEIAMELDAPKAKAGDLLTRSLFPDHPYGVTGSVMLKHLPGMQLNEAFRQQYRQVFHLQGARFVIAGPLPRNWQQDLDAALTPHTSPLPPRKALPALQPLQPQQLHHVVPDSSQCHIYQSWVLPAATHEDYTPLQVLNTVLGGAGLSARLFTELRDKQGLAYNVRSALDAYEACGTFTLYIGTEPKNRQRCLEGFAQEIDKLVNVPVPTKELEEARLNLIGRRALGLETAYQQVSLIGGTLALGRPLSYIETFEQRILAVTAEDIQRVAQTYLTQPSLVAFAGP